MDPDYGTRLIKDGFSVGRKIHFPNIVVTGIVIQGPKKYRIETSLTYKGAVHSVYIEFGPEMFDKLLLFLDKPSRQALTLELLKDPVNPRSLALSASLKISMTGKIEKPVSEGDGSYAPFSIVSLA